MEIFGLYNNCWIWINLGGGENIVIFGNFGFYYGMVKENENLRLFFLNSFEI